MESVDLYPEEKKEFVEAKVTIVNRTNQSIAEMLLDGDNLTDYSIAGERAAVAFSYPLLYRRGMFSCFRTKAEPAHFRLYRFRSHWRRAIRWCWRSGPP